MTVRSFQPDPALYPYTGRRIPVDGGVLHVLDEGTGRPVLIVHGTPSWSFEWRHVVAGLRADHRVIVPDHLGYGLSDHPAEWAYTPAAHAANLGRVVDTLGLRDITLVVHDLGGPIGLGWAAEHLDRVARIVIVNTFAWDAAADPRTARLVRFVASPLGRWVYLSLNASPRWLLPSALGKGKRLSAAEKRHYCDVFPDAAARVGAWRMGCELGASGAWFQGIWDRRDAWGARLDTIVWGMDDPAFDQANLRRWTEAFPTARLHALAGVGHLPAEEAPDAVLAALRT